MFLNKSLLGKSFYDANIFISQLLKITMLINKIQPNYTFSKINFKSQNKENHNSASFFDDDYKKFSTMQRNYYYPGMFRNSSANQNLNVVFPVNGDDEHYLAIQRSNIRKLKPKERIMAFGNPNYTADGAICSTKGFTDGICDCIAVLLHNNDKAYLFHLSPLNHQKKDDIEHMQEVLQNSISDLKKDNQNCSAFLFGGIRGASDKLYEDISEVLNKNEIQKEEVLYSKDWRIGHSLYFDVEKGIILSDEIYSYHSKQQLEENFEKVSLKNYFYSEIV